LFSFAIQSPPFDGTIISFKKIEVNANIKNFNIKTLHHSKKYNRNILHSIDIVLSIWYNYNDVFISVSFYHILISPFFTPFLSHFGSGVMHSHR